MWVSHVLYSVLYGLSARLVSMAFRLDEVLHAPLICDIPFAPRYKNIWVEPR